MKNKHERTWPAAFLCAWLLAAFMLLVTACAPRMPVQETAQSMDMPANFPALHYLQAEAAGGKVWRVDPQRSLVVIEVRRGGTLARLGHDHVVASHDVAGYVAPDEGRADLYLPLDRLMVDEAELRSAAGLETTPSAEAIDGTRRNMLEKVLEVKRFPFVLLAITRAKGDATSVRLSITLHGVTRSFDVPVQIESLPEGMAVSGQMHLNQTDFGIAPFSVLGGALQVQDRLDLHFRISAGRR
jgi:polyisoprenoid-binding protein YceI